jgi:protein BCP1
MAKKTVARRNSKSGKKGAGKVQKARHHSHSHKQERTKQKPHVSKHDDSDEESSASEKEVSVDLQFFNMSELDFHTVKQFLTVAFGATGHSVNLTGLTEFITEDLADHVGTTAKSEGEQGDPLAFCTCIPLGFKEERTRDLLDFMLLKIGEAAAEGEEVEAMVKMTETMKNVLTEDDKQVALVLNERFINLPAGVAGPMLDNLYNDWLHGIKEESGLRASHVLYLTPTFKYVKSTLDGPDTTTSDDDDPEGDQFYYQEAELLDGHAMASCQFKVATPHTTTDSRRAFSEKGVDASRRLYLLTFDRFREYISCVNEQLID